MPAACPALSPDGAFLSGMLAHLDCQAQAIGEEGYRALLAPGSGGSLVLTAMLTIFVALFGYRLLLGETPGVRDGVLAAVKIGVVLVLATSWPAYRTLLYDVVLHAPAELAAGIGQPAGLPGAGGGLVARLQRVDDAVVELSRLGAGQPAGTVLAVSPPQAPASPAPQQGRQPPRWDPARDATLLGNARTLYLAGTIGAFASVRLIAGLLLALGPLFAIFLLFDGTRGLFEGWLRGLGGAALGALATAIVLGVELALLEPWLATILAARRADIATPSVPVELFVAALVFDLTLLAVLAATVRVAHGIRMPTVWRSGARPAPTMVQEAPPRPSVAASDPSGQRTRALTIADAVAATQRREVSAAQGAAASSGRGPGRPGQRLAEVTPVVALGQGARRRTRSRVSSGARRRDTIA